MSKDKYDRQTRLWGEGQVLISLANVLCFGSDSVASEALKNLVLSGIGSITIVDNEVVNDKDIETNFFISDREKGKVRCEEILKPLLELNQDVKGEALNISPADFIKKNSIDKFEVIFSANLPQKLNNEIRLLAKKANKRFINISSNGLINTIQLYENYHANMKLRILENPVNDNRLAMPWKELIDFSMGFDLDSMDEMAHSHIPFYVILVQALMKYRKEKNDENANPTSSAEKEEFKKIIKSMIKFKDEENFKEALAKYFLCSKDKTNLKTEKIHYIFQILDSHQFNDLLNESNDIMKVFFIYCKSLQEYYEENNHTFPLVGNIPDMTADTQSYISLKKVYQTEAERHRAIMRKKLEAKLNELNFDGKERISQMILNPDTEKSVDIIDILNKNWPQMSLFKYEIIDDYKINPDEYEEDYQKVNLKWYIISQASELFNEKHQRYPGTIKNFKEDIPLLKELVKSVFDSFKKANGENFPINEIEDNYVFEFCRMGKSIVPTCASIIGSIASQEIIKMITYQFETVNNMIVYDGINVTTSTLKI